MLMLCPLLCCSASFLIRCTSRIVAARQWRRARAWSSSEGVEVLAPDAAALGQQGGEVIRPGAKGRGLF